MRISEYSLYIVFLSLFDLLDAIFGIVAFSFAFQLSLLFLVAEF